ncbi:hypothetical protein C7960_1614 [Methanohalophilus euhalobius]|uniref:Elp3/MiaA/NifB-like radical SAM core domain-containing protein n=1 Tax=Methanohalophilus euhalobius TaxID=51203 RepID=A0A285F4A1_9EURY|nr:MULTISPECIES: hypothetical protein [Methanohalophilus]ODV49937.1 MAG: hypothetical protein A8273_596 [Methanohalophilus sp. 2-GBenrich]RXG34883.1 hypothetical protein CI957_477 [Methanohalophilus sp. WG1-DM]TCL12366.1 hypothetical protein C7960_1614 [Methanohalophilus euhalobius]SNY06092.1 hypothetical protein SAMN06295989_10327 [Methanohalophilus euhalobius]
MNILLVEPDYYTKYPPLGLMKLASYYKSYGNSVKLVRGIDKDLDFHPDIIEVTSLFTYAWKPVHKVIKHYHNQYPGAKINVGGIYASLLPDHIKEVFPFVNIQLGLHEEAEDYMPSYDILKDVPKWQDWNSSILFSSRGCIRKCPFCAVPKMEGKFRPVVKDVERYIHPEHKKVIFWDNNFFATPHWKEIITNLKDMGLKVDFNQGLDARLVDEEKASMIAELKMDTIRMAYDVPEEKEAITKAVNLLHANGINKRKILFYNLYNFYDENTSKGDTPESFLDRVKYVLELGCVSYPMRFEPLTSLKKNEYVSPFWDETKLEMVAKSRRVIGFGGVFPPYEGLINKFDEARSFEEAFRLRPIESKVKETSIETNKKQMFCA